MQEAVDDIVEAVQRASSLTSQLRAISRQEQVSPERVDLSRVVSELAPLFAEVLNESSVFQDYDKALAWILEQ